MSHRPVDLDRLGVRLRVVPMSSPPPETLAAVSVRLVELERHVRELEARVNDLTPRGGAA